MFCLINLSIVEIEEGGREGFRLTQAPICGWLIAIGGADCKPVGMPLQLGLESEQSCCADWQIPR